MYENAMSEKQAVANQISQQNQLAAGAQKQNSRLSQGFGLDVPSPATPMNGATAELQMSLDVLSKVAEELRMRLAPVMRPGCLDNGQKEAGVARDVSSPLRDQMDGCTRRVGSVRNILAEILDRLEV